MVSSASGGIRPQPSDHPLDPPPISTALILAAGRGSRLVSDARRSKPETEILGLSLAERTLCALTGAGVGRCVVILGHQAERVRRIFAEAAQRCRVAVEFVEAADWERGNGASALSGRDHLGARPFFLVMTDHLFDPSILRMLAEDPPSPGGICLAVDRNTTGVFDPDDVTRVQVSGGRIREIGKGVESWNAADTGVMLCSTDLFAALERAAEAGRHHLSDGLAELAREGRAKAIDVTGHRWLDVDTPAALAEAERQLMAEVARKPGDGPVARHLNRHLSLRLTRVLVRTSATPNQISLTSFALSCLAAVLFAHGGYPALVAGGVMAQFASVVDGCDGEVARLKGLGSDFGAWFDAILDRYADAFLLFGLTWHGFATGGGATALVLGFAAMIGSYLNSYTADKYDGVMARLRRRTSFRLGRDVRVFVIFLGALLDQVSGVLALIAVVMNLEVVRRILVCRPAATG